MRHQVPESLLLLLIAVAISGCAVVGGIFKTGMAVGIFIAVVVIILLFFLFGRR